MANSSLILSSLDFNTQKANFKEFLKSQSVFKDYNFDGSNMNVLLDVMSYNTYLNAFYLNMIASEMFLDSSQKFDSIVSHAKELNYVPRSAAASVANVSFIAEDITGELNGRLSIPKGTKFFGYNSNSSYTFVTRENQTYLSPNSTFSIENLQIFEGAYFKDSYVVNYDTENQRFVISNQNIDISTIEVNVIENNGANTTVFNKAETLFGLDSQSAVFFLQGCENNQYEIVFGDGLFGRKPLNGATITVEYIVTNGIDGNGVEKFTLLDIIGTPSGGTLIVEVVNTVTGSLNGANQENIESVRFRAPRYFATQQRAVSSDDYSSLILSKFGGQIDDVVIYGGQELEPKQYGRVVVCVKPVNSTIAPDYLKDQISEYLKDYIALPNRVIISEPQYFYLDVTSVVQYNKAATIKTSSDIRNDVVANMLTFSSSHLQKFGADFRYSKFVSHIDEVNSAITSNNTKVKIIKRISPLPYFATSYSIDYNNAPELEGIYDGLVFPDERVFNSTLFTYVDEEGIEYERAFLEDEPIAATPLFGRINVYHTVNNKKLLIKSDIGNICYGTSANGPAGRVTIRNLKVTYDNNAISLYLTPAEKDVIANKNMVIMLEAKDINVDIIETVK